MGEHSIGRVLKMQPIFLPAQRFWDFGEDIYFVFLYRFNL